MTRLAPRPTPDPDRSVDMLDRTDPVGELPIVILNPHSRCNCRCAMCDIWQVTTTQEIAPADIERWLPEWQRLGVRRVVFSGGEPLMHSALWQLCGPLHEAGIDITLLSTGLLLKRHAADLARFCDDVVVSLDGPREMHNRIRNVPRAYEKLAEGVAALRAAAPGVRVSGRCTVQRANYRHLRSTVSAAWDLRLDRISFLAVDVSSKAFNRPSGWPADRAGEIALAHADLPLLADELTALETERATDFASGFIAESPAKLRRKLHQYFAALLGLGDFAPNDCNAPWVSTVIETDGTVRPCFFSRRSETSARRGAWRGCSTRPRRSAGARDSTPIATRSAGSAFVRWLCVRPTNPSRRCNR